MSLHLAAQHLQSQGRGDDDHLVHMTTGELHALNELAKKHGHSLTINPKTGLPEAGFLSAILPMALGALGAVTLDPALVDAGLTASQAGLLTSAAIGLGDYAITGSLGQGIMAGFGAYSGGQLGSDLSNFGAAPVETPPPTSTPALDPTTGQPVLTPDAQPQIAPNYNTTPQGLPSATPTATPTAGPNTPSLNRLGSGIVNAVTHPGDFLSSGPGVGMDVLKSLAPAALAGLQGLSSSQTSGPVATQSSVPSANQLKYNSPNFQPMLPAQPNPAYQATYANYAASPYNPYAAKKGGLMDVHKYADAGETDLSDIAPSSKKDVLAAEKTAIEDINKGAGMFKRTAKEMPKVESTVYVDKNPNTANLSADQAAAYLASANAITAQMPSSYFAGMQKFPTLGAINTNPIIPSQYAHGGELHGLPDYHLGDYSDGGRLLKGPGDGVSDSIPATIGHKQPARLAEGEFVIPARIVSELGNGSTDAGAKRLYDMMDRIKAKRAKAKDIAADTKAYKLLPA